MITTNEPPTATGQGSGQTKTKAKMAFGVQIGLLGLTVWAVCGLLLTTGCMSSNMTKAIKALGNDPATVNIRVTTIYGTMTFTRTNPGTNTLTHSVDGDGTIKVVR